MFMKASDTFRHPEYKHNCAQCIVYKWNALFADNGQFAEAAKSHGAGRAPEGLCGALFAAASAVPNHRDEIIEEFKAKNGATTCMELKVTLNVPCKQCIDVADDLVEKYANQ